MTLSFEMLYSHICWTNKIKLIKSHGLFSHRKSILLQKGTSDQIVQIVLVCLTIKIISITSINCAIKMFKSGKNFYLRNIFNFTGNYKKLNNEITLDFSYITSWWRLATIFHHL